jgi:DNA polymerase epsilon subunit 3
MSDEAKENKSGSTSKTPEFEPPQACVSRIIKNVLPENVQITKDARAAFTRAAGIFIFYLTHCANDFSKESKRSTIQTQDVINALKELDFGELQAPLEEFLEAYRKELNEAKKQPKEKKASGSAEGGENDGDGDGDGDDAGADAGGADDDADGDSGAKDGAEDA